MVSLTVRHIVDRMYLRRATVFEKNERQCTVFRLAGPSTLAFDGEDVNIRDSNCVVAFVKDRITRNWIYDNS
jgi:hypothetical protein